jgi:alkylated DNA nucleotide flippase Atl1
VLPTQTDRAGYMACLDATPHAGGSDPVGVAYRYFAARLAAHDDPDDPFDIQRIEDAVISGLALVSVTAQRGDNAHRIFESLNNTGLRLTQGDLLRNYLFMRLPARGDAVYHSLWLPLQRQLSSDELEMLFWLDLVQRDARIKQSDVYVEQQKRLDRLHTEAEIEQEVARFCRLGGLFKVILNPDLEPDPAVRMRLRRLNEWGTTTVYPLLLHLFDRRDQETATSEQVASAMHYVESFFVRRLLIGRATANINRILLSVVTEMRPDVAVDEAVRSFLSTGRKYYAADSDVRTGVRSVPYYLNGRPHQRNLVLRWLEESYGSKEPVAPDTLTIEHVLPQTLTPAWKQTMRQAGDAGDDIIETHEALVHTLGNLTLTGYNSKLSNKSFAVKREQLAASGILMNQEIANHEHWGRPQVLARADALAERVASLWPGPVAGAGRLDVAWTVMNQALAELPAGSWTSYGDIAALIGTHPVPVGMRLATHPAPNAHRVLQADGAISPGFRWPDPDRTDDPRDLLRAEGVHLDERGRADPSQRIRPEELAQLAGTALDDQPDLLPSARHDEDAALRDRFVEQLTDMQGADVAQATIDVLNAWVAMGGTLLYGKAPSETSCFLMARTENDVRGTIWPMTLYPSGACEVVFQYLSTRQPFEDVTLREEFRQRLNKVPGVGLAEAKLALRPSFPLKVLINPDDRDLLVEQLGWFHERANADR